VVGDIVKVVISAISTNKVSFKTDDDTWYNYSGDDKDGMREHLKGVEWGSLVEINIPGGVVGTYDSVNVLEGPSKEYKVNNPKSSPKSVVDMPRFDDVLNNFIKKFPTYEKITELVAYDMKEKWAIAKCIIKIPIESKDKGFEGVEYRRIEAFGDASLDNIKNTGVAKHFIRMAETRAFGRAMRFIMGESTVAEECEE